jgi:hypothetical protein
MARSGAGLARQKQSFWPVTLFRAHAAPGMLAFFAKPLYCARKPGLPAHKEPDHEAA